MVREEIGFGILGLGMGLHHCIAVSRARGAHLVAACDLDEERIAAARERFPDIRYYSDYAEMLRDEDVEAVSVVTPSGMHLEHGLQAAKADKHILMEKPVEITPERIQQLIDGVETSGVICGCIFQSRANPLYQKMREAVAGGRLGRMAGLHAVLPWYRADSYYEGRHGTWRGAWAMDGGGSLMNQGIHSLDLLIFLGGRIRSVTAQYGSLTHDLESEDNLNALLTFESGALGALSTSTSCYPGLSGQILVYGEKGSLHADERGLLSWRIAGETAEAEEVESKEMLDAFGIRSTEDHAVAADPMAVENLGHVTLVEDLAEAIRTGREPMIPLAEARRAPETACALYRSGRDGRAVQL